MKNLLVTISTFIRILSIGNRDERERGERQRRAEYIEEQKKRDNIDDESDVQDDWDLGDCSLSFLYLRGTVRPKRF